MLLKVCKMNETVKFERYFVILTNYLNTGIHFGTQAR